MKIDTYMNTLKKVVVNWSEGMNSRGWKMSRKKMRNVEINISHTVYTRFAMIH